MYNMVSYKINTKHEIDVKLCKYVDACMLY